MARYEVQRELDPELARLVAAAPGWARPAAACDAGDDWSGVLGCCDALRPGVESGARAAAVLPADDDWGYGAEAM
ncbi:MAG TPA: hypothetical protein VM536_23345 [Chloroflexia bacterium]|nr:hypothetical protein [Chloroflexia bacterium]